eukprot:CAMPEP_0169194874 /NCGR_PEP_ID=MMETSP1016-20121227/6919_1 /TAXON_ID=342587 /ORGANISM="Karlodinium micrum, Strain CCMP2283" /LENGTH=99 /DNA_ID=CAMNT_0009271387 /DNA_START=97 /DNA_END=397 /DNA_ORIENTATION=-
MATYAQIEAAHAGPFSYPWLRIRDTSLPPKYDLAGHDFPKSARNSCRSAQHTGRRWHVPVASQASVWRLYINVCHMTTEFHRRRSDIANGGGCSNACCG